VRGWHSRKATFYKQVTIDGRTMQLGASVSSKMFLLRAWAGVVVNIVLYS
jgi:hypothetical protein